MGKKATKKPAKKNNKLNKIVDTFFDNVVEDPLLGLYFLDTNMSTHKKKFATYMELMLAGKEKEYKGLDPFNAHKGRDIMDEATDRFNELLVETFAKSGMPPKDQKKLKKKLSSMEELVVGKFYPSGAYVYKPVKFDEV